LEVRVLLEEHALISPGYAARGRFFLLLVEAPIA
jgi:hypothetical protein